MRPQASMLCDQRLLKLGKPTAEKILLFVTLCWLLSTGSMLLGQVAITAKVVGSITDPSGAAVPNAAVTLTNVHTSELFKTTTNTAGTYGIIVPTGSYTLSVEAKGFQETQVTAFTLAVGQVARVDAKLNLGQVTQQVEVAAGAVALQTEEASVSTVIGSYEATQLPLNGRSFVQLAWLSPGVNMATPGSLVNRGNRGSLGQQVGMEANGVRDDQNRFYFDGIQSMDMGDNTFSFSPSVDAVQEFKVETSTYSAATGGAPGGQVNLITKSGTNTLHGTAWEFNRNNAFSSLPAFTPYAPNRTTARLNRNQFGANIGGPIILPKIYNGKDRSFFFFNWESGRLIQGTVGNTAFIPPLPYRTGDFSSAAAKIYDPQTGQPFPGNIIPANRIASFASKYLSFVPNPNATLPGVNYISPATSAPTTQDQYIARIDQRASQKDFVYGSYMFNTQLPYGVPTFGWDTNNQRTRVQNARLGDTHTFSPAVVNEAYVGWNRLFAYGFFGTTNNPALNIANLIGIAGVSTDSYNDGPPSFGVSGYTMPTVPANGPASRMDQVWQASDSVSIVKGRHVMHVGVDIMRRNWTFDEAAFPRGVFGFDGRTTTLNGATPAAENGLAAFLLGLGTSAQVSAIPFHTRLNNWWDDAYFQDDWKISRNLTMDLGIRYDYFSPPLQRGSLTNFAMNGVIPGWVPSQQFYHNVPGHPNTPGWPAALTYPDRKDWGPRFGFAYQVPRLRDFVVRGGYGVYYTPEITNSYTDLTLGSPLVPTYSVSTNYNTPFNAATVFATLPGKPSYFIASDFIVDPYNRSTYAQEWNLTVEKRLPRNIYVNIGYVGSKGTRLVGSYDANRPIQIVIPGPGVPSVDSRRPLQGYSALPNYKDYGDSIYHSLQAKVQRQVAHGFTILGAYTYSKVLSNVDSSSVGAGTYITATQNYFDVAADKSPAGFDQRHRFSAAAIYDLPFFAHAPKGIVRTLAGGWELSAIITEQTGFAAALSGIGDTTGTGISSRPTIVPGQVALLPRGQRTTHRWFNTGAFMVTPLGQFGNAPREAIYLPGLNDVDSSLVKNFHFRESGNVQFRADFFNLFNHVNWGTPGLNVLSPQTFGIITTGSQTQGMPNDKRIIQFGLKVSF